MEKPQNEKDSDSEEEDDYFPDEDDSGAAEVEKVLAINNRGKRPRLK